MSLVALRRGVRVALALRVCASAALVAPAATLRMQRHVSVSAAFDAGNINRLEDGEDGTVRLAIRGDVPTELEKKTFLQWFYFRARADGPTAYEIVNAGETSFPDAWSGYQVCASTDRSVWTRVRSTRFALIGIA